MGERERERKRERERCMSIALVTHDDLQTGHTSTPDSLSKNPCN